MEEELVTIPKSEYGFLKEDSKRYRKNLKTIAECADKFNGSGWYNYPNKGKKK